MIDLSKMELVEARPLSAEEELQEAKAWGYSSVEEFLEDVGNAIKECEEMNRNMETYGTIDKPKGSI